MSAKQGKEDDLRQTLLGLIGPTRKEDGCVQYDLHEDNSQPGRFLFFEKWESQEHLDRHLVTPHLEVLKSRMDELLAEPLRLLRMTQIG